MLPQQFLACLILLFFPVAGYYNGFGLRPSMGWDTWCSGVPCGADDCSDWLIRDMAKTMITNGMLSAGYNWIGIDDCWASDARDPVTGALQWNTERFPYGIKNLTTHLRELGFHFGIYTSAGSSTCEHSGWPKPLPGSFGHYAQDAQTFADWGVDMVKVDWCGGNLTHPQQQHTQFSHALNATGRSMLYQICRGYTNTTDLIAESPWVTEIAQEARATGDHHDSWLNSAGIIAGLAISADAATQKWNPPAGGQSSFWMFGDFLYTGGQGCSNNASAHCPGQSDNEYLTIFSIWCIVSSPLYVSSDVRYMTPIMSKILLNMEVIAIDQDYRSEIGTLRTSAASGCTDQLSCNVWARTLSDGSVALLFVNMGDFESQSFSVSLASFFPSANQSTKVIPRDLWSHTDLPAIAAATDNLGVANLEPHACMFYRVRKQVPW